VSIHRLWMSVPTRSDRIKTSVVDNVRSDRLISKEGTLEVRVVHSDWPVQVSTFATGDDPLGRGDRGPIPLHLILETTKSLSFAPGTTQGWEIEFSILGNAHF